ncbi:MULTISPECIES: Rv1535 domain-containing protein [Mycobacterium]|nr:MULTISPECIES: Rv1535 domain-containing protein [Mycobacterium]
MTTTDARLDPLAASLAVLLRRPLTELYALLWRVGVLEVGTRAQRDEFPGRSAPVYQRRLSS